MHQFIKGCESYKVHDNYSYSHQFVSSIMSCAIYIQLGEKGINAEIIKTNSMYKKRNISIELASSRTPRRHVSRDVQRVVGSSDIQYYLW